MSKFNLAKKFQPTTKRWKSFKIHLQSNLRHPKFVKAITSLRRNCRSIHRKILVITKRHTPQPTRHLYHHRHYFHPSVSAIYVDELFPQTNPSQEASRRRQSMEGSSNGAPSSTFNPRFGTVSQKNEKIQAYNEVGIKFRAGVGKGLDEMEANTKEENSNKYDQWKVPLLPKYRGIDDHRVGESKFGFLTENQNNEKIQTQNNEKVGVEFPKEVSKEAIKGKGNTTDEGNSKKYEKWKVPLVQKFRGIDERAEEFIAKVRQDMKLEREQSIIEFEEMLKRST